MSTDIIDSLKSLSLADKLEVAQILWEDVLKKQDMIPIPSEHEIILNERLTKIESGQTTFKKWSDLKSKYQ